MFACENQKQVKLFLRSFLITLAEESQVSFILQTGTRRPSTFSNVISETTRPIVTKFHIWHFIGRAWGTSNTVFLSRSLQTFGSSCNLKLSLTSMGKFEKKKLWLEIENLKIVSSGTMWLVKFNPHRKNLSSSLYKNTF